MISGESMIMLHNKFKKNRTKIEYDNFNDFHGREKRMI